MINIIFGVYNGYNSLKTSNGGLYYFLKSLRKYNTTCKVVIICEKNKIFKELEDFCKKMNCEIYSNFELQYQMMWYRFIIYKKYLEESNETFDKVFLSDITDVIFQDDPFAIEFTEDIYCALEQSNLSDITNSSSRLNMEWIVDVNQLFQTPYANYVNQYVVCAGTILGTYRGILAYLTFYVTIQQRRNVSDQGLLNIYVYSFAKSKNITHYAKSRILTLDKVEFSSLNIGEHGDILNSEGKKYAIIHQINRCNLPYMLQLADK